MKRALKILAAVVLVLVVAVVALFASAMSGTSAISDGERLAPGVQVVKDGFVSAFILDAGEGAVALVDAGNDKKGTAILAALARRGLGPEAVKAIFLTHGHGDHTAAVPLFPHADVYALAEEEPVIEGTAKGRSPMSFLMPRRPTGISARHLLGDGDEITVGVTTVRAFAVPGHTRGSAAYLSRGVLFFGDSASARKNGELAPAVWLFSDSRDENVTSLKALAARLAADHAHVETLAFAHSGPLAGVESLARFVATH